MTAWGILAWALVIQGVAFPSVEAADAPCLLGPLKAVRAESSLPQRPNPIKSSVSLLEREEGELAFAGTIIEKPGQLTGLKDDVYIYLIDSKGRKILSPRVPNLEVNVESPDAQYFAGHRSLYRKLSQGHPNIEIVAAGEIKIRNGVVTDLNNKSGTFRGKRLNLEYAAQSFKSSGLEIKEGVRFASVDEIHLDPGDEELAAALGLSKKTAENHAKDKEYARLQIQFHKDRDYERMQSLDRRLTLRFPHPTVPGTFDRSGINSLLMQKVRARQVGNEGAIAGYTLQQMDQDGLAFALERLKTMRPDPAFPDQVLKVLEDLLK